MANAAASLLAGQSIGDLARLGALFLGLLYTAGVLIVNLDLARYGLVSLDLARPEYLMTGGLYALLCVLPLAAADITTWKYQRETANAGRPAKIAHILTSLVMLALVPMALLGGLGHRAMNEHDLGKALLGLLGGTFVVWVNALYLSGVWREVHAWHPPEGSLADLMMRAVPKAGVVGVSVLLLALSLYVVWVFPKLPRQVGGGAKPIVRLVLTESPAIDWAELTIPSAASAKTVGPVALLLETSSQYLIAPIDQERMTILGRGVVGIDKKVVSVIVYAAPELMPLGLFLDPSRRARQAAPAQPSGAPAPGR